ncbi:MAG: hypothetical protein IJJ20_01945 [Thermoguttaceae bacterium]|nr:hypothetical protein [Thermoguttaceae bacterium]
MSRFITRFSKCLAVILLVLGAAAARADSSALAPLVNKETPAVLRISCRNADLNALVKVVVKVANKTIDSVIKDPKMAKQAKASFPLLIAGYLSGVNSLCESYKEAGLDDIYFVITPGNETAHGFFAVPLGTIPAEKVEGLKKGLLSLRSFNLAMPFCFERHGYLFAPVMTGAGNDDEHAQEQIRDLFDNLRAEPRPDIAEALEEFPGAAIALIVTGNSESSQRLAESVGAMQENTDPRGSSDSGDISAKMLRLANSARYSAMVLDSGDTSIKLRIRFEPGFDPAPTVSDLHDKLLGEILKDGDTESTELREALLNALMPVSSPERLDWKIDEAYIQENMPIIRDTVSLLRGKQEKADPQADSAAPDTPEK